MESPPASDHVRRLENIIRPGTVEHVDAGAARVRVRTGGLVSAWLPWIARRAGEVRAWSAPSIGEQCILLSPGGEPANGIVLLGLFSAEMPPGEDRAHVETTRFPDGTLCEYDFQAHRDLLDCVGDLVRRAQGAITHTATGNVLIESSSSITLRVGDTKLVLSESGITADPDILGGGRVSLVKHKHGNVRAGGDQTSGPT